MAENPLDPRILREMAGKEAGYADELKALAEGLRHPILKALLRGVANDSAKHSEFYRALLELATASQPMISEEEFRRIAQAIEKHIETEKEMVRLTEELLRKTGDPRAKLILAAIHSDELVHHRLLTSIKEVIARRETFTEEMLWDAVWRDSP